MLAQHSGRLLCLLAGVNGVCGCGPVGAAVSVPVLTVASRVSCAARVVGVVVVECEWPPSTTTHADGVCHMCVCVVYELCVVCVRAGACVCVCVCSFSACALLSASGGKWSSDLVVECWGGGNCLSDKY
jgi:hypothetical protein